ncbi:hypothetical protein Cni_G27176 [Canna indica]|uniref:Uncharacterized protein n=1 Tax=Canna indica TaxID=4628 RepID=A0AAQ3QMQ4_9LILI|nr:hypothetical protein Cni_G27176 [Canna indica]
MLVYIAHFFLLLQGCPSTLGANRKSADFFQRVPARDKNVRALFSEKVITQIEKDVGCKIKMDEKFLIVSGKDRLVLSKGVDAVHEIIQDGKDRKRSPSSIRNDSRSPDSSPKGSHLRRSESQRSHSSPRSMSRLPSRGFSHERPYEEHIRQEPHKMSRGSPQAYANEGGKSRQMRSKSPLRTNFGRDAFKSYDVRNNYTGGHDDSLDIERRRMDPHSERKFDFHGYPQSLEELEMEFKKELMELGRIHDQEEDEENYKHRECLRQLREDYLKKLSIMRGMHMKQWEEFLQLDMQRRQEARQTAYNQPAYAEYDQSSRNMQYVGSSLPMDSTNRYQYLPENYSAPRPHEAYGEFQRQRHEDFGKTYGRY